MCDPFGANKAAKQARRDAKRAEEEAKAKEAQRQADIALGNQRIDDAFSQYDDNFYSGYKDAYAGNFNPQIDKQYAAGVDKLTAALAGRGQLTGTVGINKMGEMAERRDEARAQVGNDAANAAADLRGRVEKQKTGLYSLNQASADPQGISARAIAESTSLAAPPAYSPLGEVFASIVNPYLQYQMAAQNAAPASYTPHYRTGGGSSGRVVN